MSARAVKWLRSAVAFFWAIVFTLAAEGQVGGPLMGQAASASTLYSNSLVMDLANQDVILLRDGASALAQRNGATAQAFRIYNTFTDASNYERGSIVWTSNTWLFTTQAAGTGTHRGMIFGTTGSATVTLRTNNTDRWSVGATGGELIGASATGFVQTPKFVASGASPSMGACGTSPSVTGSDSGMQITVGTGGAATTCAVTFSSAFGVAPACVVQNNTDRVAYSVVTTTTTLTITATAAFTASSIFHVVCIGR